MIFPALKMSPVVWRLETIKSFSCHIKLNYEIKKAQTWQFCVKVCILCIQWRLFFFLSNMNWMNEFNLELFKYLNKTIISYKRMFWHIIVILLTVGKLNFLQLTRFSKQITIFDLLFKINSANSSCLAGLGAADAMKEDGKWSAWRKITIYYHNSYKINRILVYIFENNFGFFNLGIIKFLTCKKLHNILLCWFWSNNKVHHNNKT